MNLGTLIEQVAGIADRGIVSFDERGQVVRRSYAELSRDVEARRGQLAGWNIAPPTRVGIMAHNSYEWIVLDLALIRMGVTSICLPVTEFERTSLEELGSRYELDVLLVGPGVRADEELPPWAARFGERPRTTRGPAPAVALDADSFSLVFSSGTSGKIKCLPISRRGTEAWIEAYGQHYAFKTDDRILVVLPLSNYQQRVMVYTGMHYRFEVILADPARLLRALKELHPTIVIGPPLFYEILENRFRALPPRQRRLLEIAGAIIAKLPFAALRARLRRRIFKPFHDAYGGAARLLLSGAAPNRHSTLELFERLGLPLFQVYGLTETGVVSWNLPGANRPGSVGKPVFPDGVRLAPDGEIIVHNTHPQCRGYIYCEPDELKQTFLTPETVATGDIGRFDDAGYLYIIGRKKQIIITQGAYKVHPETLERELEQCELVNQAVVFGGGALTGLVALVNLRPESPADTRARVDAFVEALNDRLPSASQIGRVEIADKVFTAENGLLTRNLKLDRNAIFQEFRAQLVPPT